MRQLGFKRSKNALLTLKCCRFVVVYRFPSPSLMHHSRCRQCNRIRIVFLQHDDWNDLKNTQTTHVSQHGKYKIKITLKQINRFKCIVNICVSCGTVNITLDVCQRFEWKPCRIFYASGCCKRIANQMFEEEIVVIMMKMEEKNPVFLHLK